EPLAAYAQSQTANILFAVELDRRIKERGIRATALHPGGIQTALDRPLDPDMIEGMVAQITTALAAEGKPPFQWKTLPPGAATSV
ncbi:shikimate dehydrogenase, partial [Rhizobium ruizarguesonis]